MGEIPPSDRAAFQFTLKLTREPNLVGPKDVENLLKFFTANQVAEMVQAIAGYNSTNRWTASLNIPAEENGDFFRKADAAQPKVELDSFVTPTSPGYSRQVSSVAPLKPEMAQRAPLEPFVELEKYWQ